MDEPSAVEVNRDLFDVWTAEYTEGVLRAFQTWSSVFFVFCCLYMAYRFYKAWKACLVLYYQKDEETPEELAEKLD